MKQYTLTNRLLAGVSFLITLITYTLTLQPSVPFWDCGEFSAATAWQQVPHPPGAPLFLLIGRWFHMLPFGDPGWRINMVSAVASAFTAFLCYLIIVKMIERWRPYREGRPITSFLPTFGGALIGTLAFTWCDTQWFNSVESEVYAAGTTLIASMIWLMMRWNEQADKPGHERYLLMIAYLSGLAFGIHLLALLVIPAVALVIYFRTFRTTMLGFAITLGVTAVIFYFVVYTFPLQIFPKLTADSTAAGVLIVLGLIAGLWWGIKSKKSIVALSTASMLLIFLGFSTYTHILIRANAHPPMNENEPDTVAELVKYMNREQYGYAPNWPRRYQEDQYYRSRQDVYGEWFPPTDRDEKGRPVFTEINRMGELNFMFRYQIAHMYVRYLLWNFIGRTSDIQNAGVAFFGTNARTRAEFITPTGYDSVFPIRFFALPFILGLIGFYFHFKRDWKMGVVYGALFLLMGLLATLQQNQQEPQPRERDYFYVGSFMIFAMWIGIGATALAERFGFGEGKEDGEAGGEAGGGKTGKRGATLAVAMLAVPINMVIGGWKFHDRSHIWVPWDYSYNILQSLDKDAIVFTNGDNDTFPLWYLQDVAGVRRDVRVVNLSLGQTAWYIWQLKNEQPWGAKKVPISFSDQVLKVPEGERGGLGPRELGQNETVTLDVPADVMRRLTGNKEATATTMTWQVQGMDWGGTQVLGVQHQLVRDILVTNKWQRPVYFSTSTGSDVWSGLDSYFRQEGLAYRIMPVPQGTGRGQIGSIDPVVMRKCLMETLPADSFHTGPHFGFKFRNLTNPSLFFGEDHRRLMISFRTMYLALAGYELRTANNPKAAIATLDKLESVIAPDMFGMPYPLAAEIAGLYKDAGAEAKAQKYAQRAMRDMDAMGDDENTNAYARSYPPVMVRGQLLAVMGDYDGAIKHFEALQSQYPGDMSVRAQTESYRVQKFLARKDTSGAIAEIDRIIAAYGADSSQGAQMNIQAYRQRKAELTGQAPSDTAAPLPKDTTR